MSKYQDTEYNRLVRLKSRVQDLYMKARCFRPTYTEFLKWRKEQLFDLLDYNKAPRPTKSYLEGMYDALWDELYRYHLEARSYFQGQWRTHDDLCELAKTTDFSWSMTTGCHHYWKGKPNDTELYPWSTDEELTDDTN